MCMNALLAAVCSGLLVKAAVVAPKPHILMALIDDWGWANAGYHRSIGDPEVQTPVIDELVADGIELNNHFAYKFCSPSRCALQSGRSPIHVNTENLGIGVHNKSDAIRGYAGIPTAMTGIAQLLKTKGGFRTVMSGFVCRFSAYSPPML